MSRYLSAPSRKGFLFYWWADFNPFWFPPKTSKCCNCSYVKLTLSLLFHNKWKKDTQNGDHPPKHIIKISIPKGKKWERQTHITAYFIFFFHIALRERASWSQVPCDLLETLMTKVLTLSECLITLNVTFRFNSAISVSSTFCHSLVQELCYLGL